MRPVDLPGEAVVIRFTPVDPATVLRRAEQERRRFGAYGVSVFADTARSGEDMEAVIRRLLEAAQLAGVNPATNKKYFVCGSATTLRSAGFSVYKYEEHEDASELPEHYSVDLGSVEAVPTEATVISFLGAFDSRRWTA